MSRRVIETNMLASTSEIAEEAQVSVQAVANWMVRYDDFPKPLKTLRCGPVFYLPEVVSWLRKTGRF